MTLMIIPKGIAKYIALYCALLILAKDFSAASDGFVYGHEFPELGTKKGVYTHTGKHTHWGKHTSDSDELLQEYRLSDGTGTTEAENSEGTITFPITF